MMCDLGEAGVWLCLYACRYLGMVGMVLVDGYDS